MYDTNDPEYKEWFDAKPKEIQEAILMVKPGSLVKIDYDSYYVISYLETDNGVAIGLCKSNPRIDFDKADSEEREYVCLSHFK